MTYKEKFENLKLQVEVEKIVRAIPDIAKTDGALGDIMNRVREKFIIGPDGESLSLGSPAYTIKELINVDMRKTAEHLFQALPEPAKPLNVEERIALANERHNPAKAKRKG